MYAFNHEEAARSFQHAAELDPKLAMAWWGVALAVGPNYNLPVDPDREKIAADAVDKARSLDNAAPQVEKDYIEAIAKRFSHDAQPNYQQLNANYAVAMRVLSHKYRDDLDAATLFADSMMNLRPWSFGTPTARRRQAQTRSLEHWRASCAGTQITSVQCIFTIHAVEASPYPERALEDADRIASLAPAAGHLVHMPAHIYERTGNYNSAREHNAAAAKADEDYAAATGSQGMYMMMYYSHNLHFGAISASMQGHCTAAKQSADRLAANLRPMVKDMPMVEPFLGIPIAMAVRCERWDELLAMEQPQSKTLLAFWLYGRGLALVARGRTVEAEALQTQLAEIERSTPHDDLFMPPVENHTWQILRIASDVLSARIAAAQGDKAKAVLLLRDAVANQDQLLYDEPSDWYYPVRESLGGMLLQNGDARGAEEVFRADLAQNPRNPRSLFGLAEALTRQNRTDDAFWVKHQFDIAWKDADIQLKAEDL